MHLDFRMFYNNKYPRKKVTLIYNISLYFQVDIRLAPFLLSSIYFGIFALTMLSSKRFIIEKQLPRLIMKCITFFPFLATQINNPFLH